MAETRIAVLSVHTSPLARLGSHDSGGMNVYVRRLSEELGRLGIAVDVFTRRFDGRSPAVVEFAPNVRLLHVKAGPQRYVSKHDLLDYLPEFVAGVKRVRDGLAGGYALVHGHYYLSGWVGAVLAQCWQVPHVQSFHTLARVKNSALPQNADHEGGQRIDIEAKVMASADRIIATSPSDKQDMVRHYGVGAQKISVIPPGLDLNLFHPLEPGAAKHQLGLEGKRVLLFVGRMDRIKGVETLLRTASELAAADPDLRLRVLIVGGDRQVRVVDDASRELLRLRALVAELGLRRVVQFVGPKEQHDLPAYYAAADVCVVPSYAESFGMVAVEAMACGTPVVASAVGGLRSTVVDGETGFLVPSGRPEAFARRIRQLLDSPELRARLGAAAVQAASRYRWPSVARQLATTYQALIAEPAELALAS
ncbi:MAG TPA: glycosyltransferase [Chloroflexota bacterium]|nr:glycosyltransferase [Chloroflexota bacterium]